MLEAPVHGIVPQIVYWSSESSRKACYAMLCFDCFKTCRNSPLQQSGGGLYRTSSWSNLIQQKLQDSFMFCHEWLCLQNVCVIWAMFVFRVCMSAVFWKTKGFIWYAKYSASVDISTTPTTSSLVPKRFWSQMAWKTMRPIRPKPLIPILVAMTSERFQWKDSWNLRTECLSKRFHHVPVCCKHIICMSAESNTTMSL